MKKYISQMQMLYKMQHSYLRRALNAGAQGYLRCDYNIHDSVKSNQSRLAATAAIIANGRNRAETHNHRMFDHHYYVKVAQSCGSDKVKQLLGR